MSTFAHVKRCLELSDRDIASALPDRRLFKALLDQLARISKPGDGAPKLLLLFARAASGELDWIDGALRVELVGEADVTTVDVLTELGAGMSERIFPSFKMAVPLDEFSRAVERVPHMIAPLSIGTRSTARLVLTSGGGDEEDSDDGPVGAVPIADESMYAAERRGSSKGKAASTRPPKTLRPVPALSTTHRVPLVVPRPPALPRDQEAAARAAKPAGPARVSAARIEASRPAGSRSRPPPKAPALKRASKPPSKRASVKPPPTAKGPSKAPSARPPRSVAPKAKRPGVSEPPDEEGIDTGWDEDP